MDFEKGEADLSRFGRFTVTVSNTTHETRTVHLSVKGRGVQGQGPGGSVVLKPHETGDIVATVRALPWTLDAPLKLEGMNGCPAAKDGAGGGFDIRHTTSFHIFFVQDGVASAFSVLRVTADHGARQPKVLDAKTFLPFVDRFGQFIHDEWPGKVHDEAELVRMKADEDAWLAANGVTPIPDADRFGGWAGGPQLKATGFFRTEKVNGKWWLVDPDGRLFFSHGVDCVGIGNGTTGISFRESYFSWLPAKDDPELGEFWGRVSWPAAHGFYKEKEHLPYDTFSFANANLRRKYGTEWKAEYIDRAHRRLRAWGLNTIANWSWSEIYSLDRTPYTLGLGTHGTPRLKDSKGWWGALPDPFNPEFEKTFRARARNAEDGNFADNQKHAQKRPESHRQTVHRAVAVLETVKGLPGRVGKAAFRVKSAQEGERAERVEKHGERPVAFRAHTAGVCGEAPREWQENDNAERDERHERQTERRRARMECEACRAHCDDRAEKSRVESAREPAHRIRVARQFGDERSVGERCEFGRREIHDRVEDAPLEVQLDVSRAREDEPLQAWCHHGPDGHERGEDCERRGRRHAADERVDESPGGERDCGSCGGQRDRKRRIHENDPWRRP